MWSMFSVHLQVEWKLTRGTWRPRLLDYAKNTQQESVIAATRSAYAILKTAEIPILQDVQLAIKELISLKANLLHTHYSCVFRNTGGRLLNLPCKDPVAVCKPSSPIVAANLHHVQLTTQACLLRLPYFPLLPAHNPIMHNACHQSEFCITLCILDKHLDESCISRVSRRVLHMCNNLAQASAASEPPQHSAKSACLPYTWHRYHSSSDIHIPGGRSSHSIGHADCVHSFSALHV